MEERAAYVTSNPNKAKEGIEILRELGIDVDVVLIKVPELQSENLIEIAKFRAKEAYRKLKRPVIVEDAGLFIEALNGFPGPYSSYVFKVLSNDGILKVMKGIRNRRATFRSVVAFHNGKRVLTFVGEVKGKIAFRPKGSSWGFDPIFEPKGLGGLTYAQLSPEFKNKISHRRRALEKLARYLLES
ncbi:MAG: RdgB/HAM1 family non-canonical purine NTP pyrophosphatase [Candidatus Nezhaarchaeota archaeon]|nr:RdgB/HAM1 family non-canonical purine NTP pyrophosphatase [Candidatus Nezhaarchaeota archaeon]MCX8141943.1 RdgB/HAM1 family non-canonical purine NTP pyrophosphatase [Candidatus Nezhaarchaeota archaeon]MDW8050276.1 RdgB/HAM1 family non-canonical purine NTP pyrophosphatase [Nitrososphaerota archaeon]